MKKRFSIVVGLAVAFVLPVSAQQASEFLKQDAPASAPKSRIIQRVLVKVNGEIFTQTELEHLQIEAIRDKKPTADAKDLLDQSLLPMLQQVTPDILVNTVDELILVQFGKEQGYHMTDEAFTKFVDGFKAQNKINDNELKQALSEQGMSMDAWRAMAEKQFIVDQVNRNDIMPRAQVTEEELRQYYQAHPDEFKTPSTVTLREILIAVPTQMVQGKPMINAGADDAAKTKVDAVHDRLKKGENFEKVAGEVSDSETKANGGLMSTFKLDELSPEFRKILDNMKAGDVTDPLRTPRGWQLLKLDAVSTPTLKPFDQVHEDLRAKVIETRMDAEQAKFLVKIRTQALIDWKDPGLKKMYETRLAERIAIGK